MGEKSVVEIAGQFGLTIEQISDCENAPRPKNYKSLNQVFAETEKQRGIFSRLTGPGDGSIYVYVE